MLKTGAAAAGRQEVQEQMNYKIYKMVFTGAVHFGTGGLTASADTLMADTVFSAMCTEAVLQGGGLLERLLAGAKDGKLLLSDALPFIGRTLYVPKPVMEVQGSDPGDSSIKKALKKLRYIPVEKLDAYLRGELDVKAEADAFHERFSRSSLLEKVTVPEGEVTRPYAVAVHRYLEGSGLYLCIGYESEELLELAAGLLESLSWSGIGGERSSGCGRFELRVAAGTETLLARLRQEDAQKYMSISVCLPAEDELDQAVGGAEYLAVKRSGWVSSDRYADTLRKKRDIYMMAAGAVFARRFRGDVYDVSEGGRHPVYRYGRPMLMGVV